MTFEPFPKIGRLRRGCLVTEKIDGTNAQIFISDSNCSAVESPVASVDGLTLWAGSRTRFLQPGKDTDNFGFAAWVRDNAAELVKLGPGRHFGEWWGRGIQRGYGLSERRFSLFNPFRWKDDVRPSCCHIVPILYQGIFDSKEIDDCVSAFEWNGSHAAPGFMQPEGIIVFHSATKTYFKRLLVNDEEPKGLAA